MSNHPKRPLNEAISVAQQVVNGLAPLCERIEIAGSIRRRRPQVRDIEIVAIPQRPKNLFGEPLMDKQSYLDRFLADQKVPMTKDGPKYKQFMYAGFSVDLYTPLPEWWGLRMVISTGSREFNIWLVDRVMRSRGYLMRNGKVVDFLHKDYTIAEEQDLFNLLGLPLTPPDKRDDGQWMESLELGKMSLKA
jgi:DNA polymerase/3'-5' exonuclease PolX